MINSEHLEIINRIVAKREEKGITKKEVAAHLGIAERTYYYIENGTGKLDLDRLLSICKLLDAPLEEIILGKKEAPPEMETALATFDPNEVGEILAEMKREQSETKDAVKEILKKLESRQ